VARTPATTDKSTSLDSAYRDYLRAAGFLYAVLKQVQSGNEGQKHRLAEAIEDFDRAHVALRAQATDNSGLIL
jgi:hypothetical protein